MTAKKRPPERASREHTGQRPRVSRRSMIASIVAVLALLVGATAAMAAGYLSHKVESGDTLSEIAESYGTSVQAIVELNGLDNPDLIVVDENLLIRPLAVGETAPNSVATHTVIAGDTLSQIATALGVTVEELAAANGISNPDLIVTGTLLMVPPTGSEQTAVTTETIASEADDAPAIDETTTESSDETAVGQPIRIANEVQPPTPASAVQAGSATLHLVLPGETIESIAESHGITASQLLAANGHARNGVTTGMILKVPPAGSGSVQLVGMPSAIESSPVGSELTAVSVATAYWGSSISEGALYSALELNDNPHFGFRGDINGVYGGTDDYGVYAGPLADAIGERGFVGEVFYGAGDASELTSRIDLGLPVVVWMTYETAVAAPERIDDGIRPFTVVEMKQATVIYGYDEDGVLAVDLANGGYSHINWADFMRSWNYFDGMGLAISPI